MGDVFRGALGLVGAKSVSSSRVERQETRARKKEKEQSDLIKSRTSKKRKRKSNSRNFAGINNPLSSARNANTILTPLGR